MKEKFSVLKRLSPSRRLQWFGFQRDRIWTVSVYAFRLNSCGRKNIVQKPLFWTPEFIKIGNNVHIWQGCRIEGIDSYGDERFNPKLIVGDKVSFQQNCHVTFAGQLEIGAGSSIMYNVLLTDIDHDYDYDACMPVLDQPIRVELTRIGRDCFIGAGAKIQAGTTLGDHCVVGANAVVRGSFPDHSVIVGVPARIIKRRDPETGKWLKTNTEGEFLT